jgi:Transposase DDE domain
MRLGRKGGPSKYDLAFALLSDARNRLRCHPDCVLFEAWSPSRALLKRMRDYGWYFVCRLKKNRRFNGQALRQYRRHPYWAECGWLSGGLKVLVARYGKKDYATNRLTLSAAEVRRLYGVRVQIEDVIRACKDQLGLTGCQARSDLCSCLLIRNRCATRSCQMYNLIAPKTNFRTPVPKICPCKIKGVAELDQHIE